MKKLFTVLLVLLFFVPVFASTDPEPNPFDTASLQSGEHVFETQIATVDDAKISVLDDAQNQFVGTLENVLKYRDGGGPADSSEFRVGDHVRVLADANSNILAIQDFDLQLCEQTFSGRVGEVASTNFQLITPTDTFDVRVGSTTEFRNENKKRIFGYLPEEGAELTVHGVHNLNTDEIFTETFGAYVVVLPEGALENLQAVVPTFSDVGDSTEFVSAIEFVAAEEIVSGYEDGTFAPENPINRAEFTKILMNAKFAEELDSFDISESCFPDFQNEDWFAPFVCLAKEKSILGGYPDGTFQPANEVNLAEALAILVGAFGWTVDEPAEGEEWFKPFFTRTELIDVLPEDFAEPSDSITRGQMAELVTRAIKFSRGELPDYLSK